MELLIPGLILVALMVWASTRIKRQAAEAWVAETIETADFVIKKPEGFLNVLNGDYPFEAYSKAFGSVEGRDIREATAKLRLIDNTTLDDAVADLRSPGVEITNELSEVIGEHHYRVIDAKRTERGTEFRDLIKLAEGGDKIYELRAVILVGAAEETVRKVEGLVDSFELK